MSHFAHRAMGAAVFLILAACGQSSQGELSARKLDDPAPGAQLQQISFTGIADPVTARLQIVTGPQAAIAVITEDRDGNAATVTANTAQVEGSGVTFVAKGAGGYPAACVAPLVMTANVQVLSGFKEQLRNVYARMTTISGGQSFCTTASPGPIAPPGPYVGLYFYQPLNLGTSPSATGRSIPWALNLPDNSAFWFSGDLWAEVIPQPPTNILPADGVSFNPPGNSKENVFFSWTDDPRADGSTSGETSYAVPRPAGGASLTILQCGLSSSPFNPALCSTTSLPPTVVTTGTYAIKLHSGSWYQWSLQTSFLLPGNSSRTLGSAVTTRHFQVL